MKMMLRKDMSYLKLSIIVLIVLLAGVSADDGDSLEYSQAQILLFNNAHLVNIDKPSKLAYSFMHRGEEEIDDFIGLTIKHIDANNKKDVDFEFLTGDREMDYPGVKAFSGNPLIMLFMEWNVTNMQAEEKTGVNELYLRNQLRVGFWKHCEVEQVEIEYQGEKIFVDKITMRPFMENARLEYIKNKYYEFYITEKVPGGIWKIAALDSANKHRHTTIHFTDIE